MKQKLLLLLGLLLWSFNMNVVLADDQPNVTVIEDLDKYEGTDPFVYNQADGKVYVLNNVGSYERYGVYERVSTLKVAGGGDTEIEYIETTTDMSIIPYINTGYVHKANTRIVAEVNITDNSVRNLRGYLRFACRLWQPDVRLLLALQSGQRRLLRPQC